MIHKLSTQTSVGQKAEGSGRAAVKRKTGLQSSLTCYDAVVKNQNQISCGPRRGAEKKNLFPAAPLISHCKGCEVCTVAKTLWAAVCVGECLQNRKPVLIFGDVPIAGTGVEEGRKKKKERGRGISFGERAEPRLQETRRDNAQVAAGGRGWLVGWGVEKMSECCCVCLPARRVWR